VYWFFQLYLVFFTVSIAAVGIGSVIFNTSISRELEFSYFFIVSVVVILLLQLVQLIIASSLQVLVVPWTVPCMIALVIHHVALAILSLQRIRLLEQERWEIAEASVVRTIF
jgi:hypothetical protein